MGVICASNGGPYYRSLVQPISLGTLLLIIIVFIVTGSLGSQLFTDHEKSRSDLCIKYVQYPESINIDYEAAFIVTVVLSLMTFFLSGFSFWKASKSYFYDGYTVYIFPFVLLLIAITLMIITFTVFYEKYKNKNKPTTLRPDLDGTIVNWCLEKNEQIKNNYIAFSVFFIFGLLVIFIYALDFFFKGCIRY